MPRQREHGCCIWKKPWETRIEPLPLQVSQVTGEEPLAAPLPEQVSHSINRGRRQLELEFIAQIGTAEDLRTPPAPATAEDIAEDIAEDVAEVGAAETARAATAALPRRIEAVVPVLVVDRALLRIGEHFVGFFGLLEALFGVLVIRIAVRMVFHGEPPIGLLDLGLIGGLRYPEDRVVVGLGHGRLAVARGLKRPCGPCRRP